MKYYSRSFALSIATLLLTCGVAHAFGTVLYADRALNLRAGRTSSAKWIGFMYPGQKVRVDHVKDGWGAIYEPNETRSDEKYAVGYSYVKFLKPEQTRYEPKEWGELVTVDSTVNIRNKPSTSADKVDSIKPGERVVLDFPDGDWVMVFSPDATIRSEFNRIGYAAARLFRPAKATGTAPVVSGAVTPPPPTKTPEPKMDLDSPVPAASWGKVITVQRKVNLREKRTTGSRYIRTLKPGEKVKVDFLDSGWYAVFLTGEPTRDEGRAMGYVLQDLLEGGPENPVVAKASEEPKSAPKPEPRPEPKVEPRSAPPVKPAAAPSAPPKESVPVYVKPEPKPHAVQQTMVLDQSKITDTRRPDPVPNKTAHGYRYRVLEKSQDRRSGENWTVVKVFLGTDKLPSDEGMRDFASTLWQEYRRAGKFFELQVYLPGMDIGDIAYGMVRFSNEKFIEQWVRKTTLYGTSFR